MSCLISFISPLQHLLCCSLEESQDKRLYMVALTLVVTKIFICSHLRNEFDFWNVHGIMNNSGLLQSKWDPKYS